MSESRWTDEERRQASLHGLCQECQGPRSVWMVTAVPGPLAWWAQMGLGCIRHPEHGPDVPPEVEYKWRT